MSTTENPGGCDILMQSDLNKYLDCDISGALKDFHEAFTLYPLSVPALECRARMYELLGSLPDARKDLELANDILHSFRQQDNVSTSRPTIRFSATSTAVLKLLDNLKGDGQSSVIGEQLKRASTPSGRASSSNCPRLSGSEPPIWRKEFKPITWIEKVFVVPPNCKDPIAQDLHALVQFMSAYSRTGADHDEVAVTLKLDEVCFGIRKCLKHAECLGRFISKFEIEAAPLGHWKSCCILRTVKPGDDHDTLPVQQTRTRSLNLAFTAAAAPGGPQVAGGVSLATTTQCLSMA